MTRVELIKTYEKDRDYYFSELTRHENMNPERYYTEQKAVYFNNIKRLKEKLKIIEETLKILKI